MPPGAASGSGFRLGASPSHLVPEAADILKPGQAFGERYHIIRLLGRGGMGAVYQAWDAELGVDVAIKTIRVAEGVDRKAAEDMERRFKRELLLARQVTHPNVVRIYDLGEIEGTKYITMSYVEGEDLATILKADGKLPVAQALSIMRQVVSGMRAAHAVGIVHRDLKPANIMIDKGVALIMDFGIARSVTGPADQAVSNSATRLAGGTGALSLSALTVAGSVMGTLDYMAPEQATANPVDQRADVYALGLIFYDIILDRSSRPRTGNPLADFRQRKVQPLAAPKTIDPGVPEAIDAIITKCLQPDPAARFQTTDELAAALDQLDDQGNPKEADEGVRPRKRWFIAAAALLAIIVTSTWWFARTPPVPVTPDPVSVLIADFDNQTSDSAFDGLLEQGLAVAIEGASFITNERADAQRLNAQLRPGRRLDEEGALLLSRREGVKVVLAGSIARDNGGYRLTVRAIDPIPGTQVASATSTASSKADVLTALGTLATTLRGALGDTTPESARLAAMETFTAASLDAAQDFSKGQELASSGKDEEAITYYKRALERDPKFGRAYASWGVSARKLGRRDDAVTAYKNALSLLDRMSEREKYRTLGVYFLTIVRNYEEAVENYKTLVQLYPADRAGHSNLAIAYFYLRDFAKALPEARRTVEIYPKIPTFRSNYALIAMYAGDFETAEKEARQVIEQTPDFAKAYLPLAMKALAAGDLTATDEAYARMMETGPPGASLATMGRADLAMYKGQFKDAATLLTTGIAADRETKNTTAMAAKLLALAETHAAGGQTALAMSAVDEALKLPQDDASRVAAARILIGAGRLREGAELATALGEQLQAHRRAYARMLEGEIALKQDRTAEAVEALQEARKLSDAWLVRFDLGVAFVKAGHYAEAVRELELCLKRHGEATAVFLDDLPTYRYMVPLYYWLGRAQEGLGILPAAAANYRHFLDLRADVAHDPLAMDAKRRVSSAAPGQP